MASQIFNFPGFFDREIDASQQEQAPIGIPAGVVGPSERGPAFVPTTLGSFPDFESKFGSLNVRLVAPYAVERHLENSTGLTFIRVLGAGGNTTAADIETTRIEGTVANAGFKVSSSLVPTEAAHFGAHGTVQFLVARHIITGSEAFSQLGFTRNDSLFTSGASDEARLVRGMIFVASGARLQVLNHDEVWATTVDDAATANSTSGLFKIVISSSEGSSYSSDEGNAGIRILTASLNPTSDNYFVKVLNTNPEKFEELKHVVYANFAVDNEVATVATGAGDIVIASGSAGVSANSGDTALPFQNAFGRFDTRYTNPKTTKFISQPFGTTEYDLFHIEGLDDGDFANKKFKISVSNLKRSANPRNKFGSFALVVRKFDDTDTAPVVLEQYSDLSLDPEADNYICRVIGDRKAFYNFDAESESDRRLVVQGRFPNKSKVIRVIATDTVEDKKQPAEALPFGFHGLETISFNSRLTDRSGSTDIVKRLAANLGSVGGDEELLTSIVPPVPYRFKVTRGAISTAAGKLEGAPGSLEIVDTRYHWGVKTTRNKVLLNANVSDENNELVDTYTQFLGISKLDVMVTGSDRDNFHDHKFTLARVAFANGAIADITSSAADHMKEAAYLRNGTPDVTNYKITDSDGSTERITLATLLNNGTTAAVFNAFTAFAKFTTVMQGGFDGTNILDKNAATLNDRATSSESRTDGVFGNTNASFTSPGFAFNQNGTGITNNAINSYRVGANIITDAIASNVNVVAFPGQREPLVTDYVADKVRSFGLAMYVMDLPNYNADNNRVFDGQSGQFIDPENTANAFETRALDNEFVASYFPDVVVDDAINNQRVTIPGSIAAVSALSFNDKVAYPWFAPAGFNRASLDFVNLTTTRINQGERDRLFDVHINPIVKFPREGHVIFSQNTLEQAESALGSVNVVRMLNDVKRQIIDIGNRLVFEQMTPELRQQFVKQATPILSAVQVRQGIESFRVISDSSNNTNADLEANQMNVRIILVPTRAVEFIAIDFIITRSGVQFV